MEDILYTSDIEEIHSSQLKGFFVGWPNPPSEETFLNILKGSYRIVLALDKDRVIGFINAISDGTLNAYNGDWR